LKKLINKRFLAICLVLAMIFSIPAMAIPEKPVDQLAELNEIAAYIRYYSLKSDGINPIVKVTAPQLAANPNLFMDTVKSWLTAYGDRFSYFLTKEEYEAYFPTSESYIGIGIRVASTVTGAYITEIVKGGPAEGRGMYPGCQIVRVDGVDVSDMFYEDITALIRGQEGTSVTLGYIEPGSTGIKFDNITRRYIDVPNVTYSIEGKTGYINVAQFGDMRDALDFDEYYNKVFPKAGVEYVIIDVRGNPGGAVDTLLGMLNSMTRDKGKFFFRLKYARNEVYEYFSDGNPEAFKPKKIVLLADDMSASCSEVFVGALQELGMAELVGVPTYGKARSQFHIGLTSGDVLIITASTVELLNIGEYQEVGIIPKHRVENTEEKYPMPALSPLDTSRAIFPFAAMSARWLAVEERLSELGYFYAVPDEVCDEYTIWCVNRFQAAQGLSKTRYASVAMLRALNGAIAELALTEGIYTDRQMEYAEGLCK